jgi:hypothetical protein
LAGLPAQPAQPLHPAVVKHQAIHREQVPAHPRPALSAPLLSGALARVHSSRSLLSSVASFCLFLFVFTFSLCLACRTSWFQVSKRVNGQSKAPLNEDSDPPPVMRLAGGVCFLRIVNGEERQGRGRCKGGGGGGEAICQVRVFCFVFCGCLFLPKAVRATAAAHASNPYSSPSLAPNVLTQPPSAYGGGGGQLNGLPNGSTAGQPYPVTRVLCTS